MDTYINKIDENIEKLRQCKEILAVALVDDKDSVSSLNDKLDEIIEKLENGRKSILDNKAKMDRAKVW